ncbi:MAG: hypothetical protein ABI861_09715 [Panacibacter sp.]
MRTAIILLQFSLLSFSALPQKGHYDSIREMLRKDSIEYQEQLRDADRIKVETDSLLKRELGITNKATAGSDSTVIKNLRTLAIQELKKKAAEENKRYYLLIGSGMLLLIIFILLFKRKQFVRQGDKNSKAG